MKYLRPSKIRYSQDSISNTFFNGKLIGKVLDAIVDGRLDVDDIEPIEVIREDHKWISADNRRLWVFKKAEELGACDKIPVEVVDEIPESKRTADSDTDYGRTIRVRGHPGGHSIRELESSSESESDDSDLEDLFRRFGIR